MFGWRRQDRSDEGQSIVNNIFSFGNSFVTGAVSTLGSIFSPTHDENRPHESITLTENETDDPKFEQESAHNSTHKKHGSFSEIDHVDFTILTPAENIVTSDLQTSHESGFFICSPNPSDLCGDFLAPLRLNFLSPEVGNHEYKRQFDGLPPRNSLLSENISPQHFRQVDKDTKDHPFACKIVPLQSHNSRPIDQIKFSPKSNRRDNSCTATLFSVEISPGSSPVNTSNVFVHHLNTSKVSTEEYGNDGVGELDYSRYTVEQSGQVRVDQSTTAYVSANEYQLAQGQNQSGHLLQPSPVFADRPRTTICATLLLSFESKPSYDADTVIEAKYLDCLDKCKNLERDGQFDLAEPMYKDILGLLTTHLGRNHQYSLSAMFNLASLYLMQGKLDLAEPLHVECLQSRRVRFGDEHPDTLASVNNVASVYALQGKYALAEPLYETNLEQRRAQEGNESPATLHAVNDLAR